VTTADLLARFEAIGSAVTEIRRALRDGDTQLAVGQLMRIEATVIGTSFLLEKAVASDLGAEGERDNDEADFVWTGREVTVDRPAMIVIFELEHTRPRVYLPTGGTDRERLWGWLTTRAELGELAVRALELYGREDAET
jgi:hypothetical protein